jgi:membrane fusion protein (multidrug efflux system)
MKRVIRVVLMAFLFATVLIGTHCASDRSAAPPSSAASGARVDVVRVISKKLNITVSLPGGIRPYEIVAVYPKVTGFLQWIGVDRGSRVKRGQLLARLTAPELGAERRNAEARLRSTKATLIAVQAALAADESTYQSLKSAAATPGVVAGNELQIAKQKVQGDRARVRAAGEQVAAAQAALRAAETLVSYLLIRAPFDGVVIGRNAHPGDLVGPGGVGGTGSSTAVPMLRIEMLARLRLVVPVPEIDVGGIVPGALVHFTVPAFPRSTFTGKVARISHYLHVQTRTMPVEADVANPNGRLAPGMFPQVRWPVRRSMPTLFVPATAVITNTQGTFVIRVRDGRAERVQVETGETEGRLVEVFGDLKDGDEVAVRATEEIAPGAHVVARLVAATE